MIVPHEPSFVDVLNGLIDVAERLVERDHMLDQHRDPETGEQARFTACPADPCQTWRQFSVLLARWQSRRMP